MQQAPDVQTKQDAVVRTLTTAEIEQIAGATLEAFPIFPR